MKSGLLFDRRTDELERVDRNTSIAELAIDSLQLSDVIFNLEDKFDVEISDDTLLRLTSCETVGEFLDTFADFTKSVAGDDASLSGAP